VLEAILQQIFASIDAGLLQPTAFGGIVSSGKFPLRDLKLFFGKDEN